jgi:anti-sigma28 factor (negative regulator of flagellin synthesis)
MSTSFRKLSNANFVIWLGNLVNFHKANEAVTKLNNTTVSNLETKKDLLAEKLAERQLTEDKLSALNTEIKELRVDTNKIASQINAQLKSDPTITNSTIEQLGFSLNDSVPTSSTPNVPLDLVVTGASNGINTLKWRRNGNSQGTMFVIEAKIGEATEYTIVNAVTNTTFEHINQIPGVKVQYRVKAKRAKLESSFSNIAVVYS